MKGDFSRFLEYENYEALLVQQGRPLLDSQINALAFKSLTPREILKHVPIVDPKAIVFSNESFELTNVKATINKSVTECNSISIKSNNGAWADSVLLGSRLEKSTEYTLFVQTRLNSLSIEAEPEITGSEMIGLVAAPNFGLAETNDELASLFNSRFNSEKEAPKAALKLMSRNSENQTIRFEVHSTHKVKEEGQDNGTFQIYQIKWAFNNASDVFEIAIEDDKPKIVGDRIYLKKSGLPSRIQPNTYVEIEFANGVTLGTDLYRVRNVQSDYVSVEPSIDEGIKNAAIAVRIWNGIVKPVSKGEKMEISTDYFDASLAVLEDQEQISFIAGDYWIVSTRKGEKTFESNRLNESGAPIAIGILKLDANFKKEKFDLTRSHFTPASGDVGNRKTVPENQLRRIEKTPIEVVMSAPACSLGMEPKTLAVTRWLASTKLDEIASLSKSQLRDRIKRDCSEKEYDDQSMEADLDMIITRRAELLPQAILV